MHTHTQIADFGMSCDLEDDEVYYYSKGGKIPIKWMAPEAVIKRKYSLASDIWSYGCVLYEIWSLGRKPFATYSNIYVSSNTCNESFSFTTCLKIYL